MARVDIKMPDEFLSKLSRLGSKTDEICEAALEAGAEVVEDKVRSNLRSVIGSGVKVPSRSTGELLDSLGVSPMKMGKGGVLDVKIGFNEPRRKQYAATGKRSYYTITNAMIANVLEYGKSGQPPKPFLKPAKSASRKACIEAMKKKLDEEVEKL